MIVWLNGPFGVGKTSVAAEIVARDDDLVIVDTELLGYAIRPVLGARLPVDDFQDWRTWRRLVVAALSELEDEAHGDLVVPQTVLVESYWDEIQDGLRSAGHPVVAFTLDVDAVEHARRVDTDVVERGAREWRHRRWADYLAARDWLSQATHLVDTTSSSTRAVAERVMQVVREEAVER